MLIYVIQIKKSEYFPQKSTFSPPFTFKTLILECNSQNQLLLAAQIEISTLPFQCGRPRPIHVLSNKLDSCPASCHRSEKCQNASQTLPKIATYIL